MIGSTTSTTVTGERAIPTPPVLSYDYYADVQEVEDLNPADLSRWSSMMSRISPRPTYVSCSTRNQDPDAGITSAYCVCSGSTFPPLTSGTLSCAYTSPLPASQVTVTTWQVPVTYTNICKVCTIVGGAGGYLKDCTSLEGCKPAPTCTPQAHHGDTKFYIWDVVAWPTYESGPVPPVLYAEGTIFGTGWDCDLALEEARAAYWFDNTLDLPYAPEKKPRPDSFSITAGGKCGGARLNFQKQCDG